MKSFIPGAIVVTAIAACLSLNVQAGPIKPVHVITVSDTGKMAKDKMKMDKMNKKKMSKMSKDSMKMDKMKMDKKMSKKKMAKDTSGKM